MDIATPRTAVVIPAAGRGKRFGSPENKIWAELGGQSVLERTLAAFSTHSGIVRIVIAAGEDELDRVRATAANCAGTCPIEVVTGGETRSASVRCGLDALGDDIEIVLVHDAARPLVSGALIDRVIAATIRTGAAVPGLPLSDTVKRADSDGLARATIPRTATIDGQALTGLTAVQTPQGAMLRILRRAYAEFDFTASEPTDEAELLRGGGLDAYAVGRDADACRNRLLHSDAVRHDLRRFGYHRGIDVDGLPPSLSHPFGHGLQQAEAGYPPVGLVGVREEDADIAQAQRAEQSVADGVKQHVGVGMSLQSTLVLDLNAAEKQPPPGSRSRERVDIVAESGASLGGVMG